MNFECKSKSSVMKREYSKIKIATVFVSAFLGIKKLNDHE